MASLILELQFDCLDGKSSISSLLRKALVVSRKLGVPEIEAWINSELNGYDAEVPSYRRVKGQVKARHPFRGWIPVQFSNTEEAELITYQNLGQPAAELEDLVKGEEQQTLTIYFSDYIQKWLQRAGGHNFQCALHVSSAKVASIFDAVRTRLLEWALDMEKKGIVGDGLTFSSEEKAAAAAVSYVTNNHIGAMHNSQLQQHAQHSPQTMRIGLDTEVLRILVQELQRDMGKFELEPEGAQELAADLATLHSQAGSPRPKLGVVRETLKSVRTILEGAAGNVGATVFGERVLQFLQTLG